MKNRFMKVCSIFLVMVLLFNMLPLQAFADGISRETPPALNGGNATDVQGTPSLGRIPQEEIDVSSLKIVKEIPEKRTEFSKEFLMSNGLRMATVYNAPIHYQENGQWKEIDNTLTVKSDGTIRNTAGVWDVAFPQQLSAGKYITVTKDGYTLRFGMDGVLSGNTAVMRAGSTFSVQSAQTSTAQIEQLDTAALLADERHPETVLTKLNAQLAYSNVYSNTNIVYDLQSNKIKESVIISRYDSSLQGYRYVLDVGSLVPVLNEDNSIWFFDESKTEIVMVMPAPFMVDAEDAYNYDVQVQLTGSGSRYTLTYLLPQQWLAAEERAWPVVLDPVVTADTSASNVEDVTISQYQTFSDTATAIRCGYSTDYGITRALFKYVSLPSLTSADVIVQADIRMYETYGQESNGTPVEVHKVTEVWQSSTVNWANAPDFETAVEDFALVGQIGNYYWDVTNIVRDWYAEENTGMLFKIPTAAENNHTVRTKLFASADATANKPALNIYIRNANGLEDYWDYTASSAGRAGTGYVNNYTGNLVWVRSDMGFGGNRMPVSISHIYNLNDAINPSDSNNANDTGGNVFGLGVGWRTNFNQRVFYWQSNGDYYGWEDADGTDHYFKLQDGVYKDEDGLDLTLAIVNDTNGTYRISDKYGNCSYFDAYGRLVKLSNNQEEQSHITITYDGVSYRIATIKDGVNRVYRFVYTNGLLSYIRYEGSDNQEHHRVSFTYQGDKLYKVVDADIKFCTYTYTGVALASVEDVDGYTLTYTHTTPSEYWQPYRVLSVSETDDNVDGGELTFAYDHNQTTITDHNGNVQVMQFNNWGNTIAVYDDEGRGAFARYTTDENPNGTPHQLTLSSDLQTTLANALYDADFESTGDGDDWFATADGASFEISDAEKYLGNYSLQVSAGATLGVYGPTYTLSKDESITFSAYVKGDGISVYLTLADQYGMTYAESDVSNTNNEWSRIAVSCTNNTEGIITIRPQILAFSFGEFYVDCVEIEQAIYATKYNLVKNGDFSNSNSVWSAAGSYTVLGNTDVKAPQLDTNVYKISGTYDGAYRSTQTVYFNGNVGDTFVLSGWAKGNATPTTTFENSDSDRLFALQARFVYLDNTYSPYFTATFNPSVENWQYSAIQITAPFTYKAISVCLVYDNGANEVYFDGIQLYEGRIGTTYGYTDDNLSEVTDSLGNTTWYTYDAYDRLETVTDASGVETVYEYDSYHNLTQETVTAGESVSEQIQTINQYTYDAYGNQTSSSASTNGATSMVSSARYSNDGNRLLSSTDTAGNTTWYQHNVHTNLLERMWYPKDSEGIAYEEDLVLPGIASSASVVYTYDNMFRVIKVEEATGTVAYTYTEDQLTGIGTDTTDYSIDYGLFGQRECIYVDGEPLLSYSYTEDSDHRLSSVDFNDGSIVYYEYDEKGKVLRERYNNSGGVEYIYNLKDNLARRIDTRNGIIINYSYDTNDRLIKYGESGVGYSHSVEYSYNQLNQLIGLVENIGNSSYNTTYGYDVRNRLNMVIVDLPELTALPDILELPDALCKSSVLSSHTYDELDRPVHQQITSQYIIEEFDSDPSAVGGVIAVPILTKEFGYATTPAGKATNQVSTYTVSSEYASGIYQYTYDDNGNITEIQMNSTDADIYISYIYDDQNRLIRENHDEDERQFTYVWEYDDAGNILSRKEYNHATGTLGTLNKTVTYTYDGNVLTGYDGKEIVGDIWGTYSYDGWIYETEFGNRLVGMRSAENPQLRRSFTYNADGMRTRRVEPDGTVYEYVYNGSLLTQMTIDKSTTAVDYTLFFSYDAAGLPVSVTLNGTTYYYVTNLQGDVVGILDGAGIAVAHYTYDAWGNVLRTHCYTYEYDLVMETIEYTTDLSSDVIGVLNPLRYRGYVYDKETKLYYLQSRYYNPEWGRFITADNIDYLGVDGTITSYNAFAYCSNNPVMGYDPFGTFDFLAFRKGVGRIAIGISAIVTGVLVCIAGAPVVTLTLAAFTVIAGGFTLASGAADIQQSVTGDNFVRDGLFRGNQLAYDFCSSMIQYMACAGTVGCANYLQTECVMRGAVPGTEGKVTLERGTLLDRYGSNYGRYFTDPGTATNQLALSPKNSQVLTTYVVNRPITFRTGTVASCSWGAGGGVQYFSWMSAQRLVQFRFLKPLG